MKINDLDGLKKAIGRAVLVAFCVIFALSNFSLWVAYYKLEERRQKLHEIYIQSAVSHFQLNISEQLGIIARSDIFLDYLRSGDYSRRRLYPDFLIEMSQINSPTIGGMEILSEDHRVLFSSGCRTNYSITLALSYFDRVLDNQFGSERYFWVLYFYRKDVGTALCKINPAIRMMPVDQLIKGPPMINVWKYDNFGSFKIVDSTPMLIAFAYEDGSWANFYSFSIILFVMLITFAIWIRSYIRSLVSQCVADPLQSITLAIRKGDRMDYSGYQLDEVKYLISQINGWKLQLDKIQQEQRDAELGRLVTQVVHDIRSPLVALDVASKHLTQLPEEQRLMLRNAIQRINDIANNLLQKHRREKKGIQESTSPELLSGIIELIVSEKRVQYSDIGVAIEVDIEGAYYGIFAKIHPIEFKRVLSNLINNAVESLVNRQGGVKVKLSADTGYAYIKIADNGCGIPQEYLSQIFEKGKSFKKSEGSGLGLFHAKTFVEAWGGKILIESQQGVGTEVTVVLPRCEAAPWFFPEIKLRPGATVVVVDDDISVHDIWDRRLLKQEGAPRVQIVGFKDPSSFTAWYNQNKQAASIFLVDYEFLNIPVTGVDLIEQLNITDKAVLVTSHFEDFDVRERCKKLGLKIMPKNFAAHVPVKEQSETPDLILLDDDLMLAAAWQFQAFQVGKKILTFASADPFLKAIDQYPKDTPLYIDSDLGDKVRGEDIARDLHQKGFSEIYLATGLSSENFPAMPWIRAIVGKEPPFAGK